MPFRSFATALTIGVAVLVASSASASDADPGRHAGDLVRLAPDLYGHDLLRNAEVAAETKTILGPAYERFDNTLNVTGKVDLIGGRYVVGTGCRPHSCVETKATLVVDTTTGDVYAALRDEEGSVERPKRSAWPDEVRRVFQDDVEAAPSGRDPAPSWIASRSAADILNPVDLDGRVIWDHNGSEVLIDAGRGVIVYNTPKSSIAGTVRIGQVLFRGDITPDGPVSGTAYTFKKGCAPAPYQVSGRWRDGDLVLRGAAPRRSKTGCGVDGYTTSSGNATLKFTFLMSP